MIDASSYVAEMPLTSRCLEPCARLCDKMRQTHRANRSCEEKMPMEIVKQEVTLQTGGGKMSCHLARPAGGGPHPGLAVLMEAFGLNDQIKRMADRFAAEGFVAIAPNLYHRQPDNVVGYDDLPGAFKLMGTIKYDEVVGDVNAAINHLKGMKEVKPRIGTTGFCMGGTLAFLAACRNSEVAATVPFYGGGMTTSRQPGVDPPIKYVAGLKAPVLAFFGGKDAFIPITEVDKFRDELKKAGKPAEVVLYADADHGFMCEDRPQHHPAHAKQAFARTVAFFKEHLA
jgi:carboxymethylenebutenolidase